jgi:hypothetical protein
MGYEFNQQQIDDIIDKYKIKMGSINQISKEYGVDGSVIKRVLKEAGVEIVGGSPFSVNYWIKKGLSKQDAEYKIKTLKPTFIEYWLNKGYSHKEAEFRLNNFGDNGLESCINNHGEEEGRKVWEKKLKSNIESNKKSSKRRVEYWLNKGFNEEEAKEKVSEHQTTFSLKKCIDKYGESQGLEIFNERQEKWLKNFNKAKQNNGGFDHDSLSISSFVSKYGEDWKGKWTERILKHYKNDDLYLEIIKNVKDIEDFKEFLLKNKDKIIGKNIKISLYNSKLLKEILGIDSSQLRYIINITLYGDHIKTEFGVLIRENGVLYRSLGEYELSKFFNEKNIDFIYEKKYPNSLKKCDFYIKESDMYIELTGMLTISEKRKNSKNIIRNYKNNLKQKMDICLKNNLKCVFLNNINEIKNLFNNE